MSVILRDVGAEEHVFDLDRTAAATADAGPADMRDRARRFLAPAPTPPWAAPLAAAVVLVTTWPIRPDAAAHGVDNSYLIGLAMARQRGFRFGDDLIFNFGPLGFLGGSLSYRGSGLLSWAVQLAVQLGVIVLLLSLVRRIVSLPIAVLVAVTLITLIHPDAADVGLGNQIVVLAVLWSVSRAAADGWTPTIRTAAFAAALSVLALLVKLDTGLICVVATGTAVALGSVQTGGVRRLAVNVGTYATAAVATLLVGFAASNGGIGGLTSWLRGSYQIVAAFSGALGLSRSGAVSAWEHAGVAAMLVAWIVLVARTDRTRWARVGTVALVAVLGYLAFRQGFVRYDVFHVRQFIAVALMLPVSFSGVWSPRAVAAMTVAAIVVFLPGQRPSASTLTAPADAVRATFDTAAAVLQPGRADDIIAARKAGVRATYVVPDAMLDRIGDETVSVLPIDIEIAYGYPEIHWQPLPIFQDYQANDVWLDDRNRDAIESADRPHFLLRDAVAKRIDGQFPRFQPPAENLAILCHYRVVMTASPYELLEATTDRCGDLRDRRTTTASLGTAIDVPTPTSRSVLVVARFDGVAGSLTDRLLTTLYRGPDFFVAAPEGDRWYRYVPGTQESWHVLAAPGCADALPAGTAGAFDSITLSDSAGPSSSTAAFDVEFAEIPFDCPS